MGMNTIINKGTISGSVNQIIGEKSTECKEKDSKSSLIIYDLAISYASEQEEYVTRVKKILEEENLKVFFAPDVELEYKGKDMYTSFYRIYRYKSKYVACFVSKEYIEKDYTMSEYEAARLMNKDRKENCIFQISFQGVKLPHLDKDINYFEADQLSPIALAASIADIIKNCK